MSVVQKIFQVDAFADAAFAGNPAAVMPLTNWLDDEILQQIAMENNLSETAFFVATPDDPDSDFHLRWFTPSVEVNLCGHATLATAFVLTNQLGFADKEIRFRSKSGILVCTRREEQIELDFPAAPANATRVPDGLAKALGGIEPVGFLTAFKNMAVLTSEDEVLAVTPDLDFIRNMEHGLIVTAPGKESDVASRYFGPSVGIDEDPVTGSAHCTIVPYWAQRLGKENLVCRQVSPRGGTLYCQLVGDRVKMAGSAHLYMEGTVFV